MSARGFGSVFMVASCAGAALGCYLVSLRVASERAALEDVETQIVLAQRDIRVLQTEIGTRGRLAQLERWNVKVLALSAPSADQFLNGGFELARLVQPKRKIDIEAPVVLAAAPGNARRPQVHSQRPADALPDLSPSALMQTVSLKRELPAPPAAKPQVAAVKVKAPAKTDAAAPKGSAPAKAPVAAAADKKKPAPAAKKPGATEKKTGASEKKAGTTEKKKAAALDPLAPLKASPAKPRTLASSPSKETAKTP